MALPDSTPNKDLTLLEEGGDGGELILNQLSLMHDRGWTVSVITFGESTQPGSPAEGDAYVLGASPSGSQWGGFSQHDVVFYINGAWLNYAPFDGLWVYGENDKTWRWWSSDQSAWAYPHPYWGAGAGNTYFTGRYSQGGAPIYGKVISATNPGSHAHGLSIDRADWVHVIATFQTSDTGTPAGPAGLWTSSQGVGWKVDTTNVVFSESVTGTLTFHGSKFILEYTT